MTGFKICKTGTQDWNNENINNFKIELIADLEDFKELNFIFCGINARAISKKKKE